MRKVKVNNEKSKSKYFITTLPFLSLVVYLWMWLVLKKSNNQTMLLSKEAKCEICLKVISSSANLKTHMILKHAEGDEGNYKCLSCNKGFIRLCDLNNHKQGHNGSQRKLNQHFKCKCSRKFVSIEKLLRHQKIHEEKPFACQSCGFRTSTNSLLDM